ncbi:MAG: M24 family metallopeptidase, partial [Clostridia bacterium]
MNETTITQRTDKVRKAAADQGVDGILLGLPENMYYFSGFRTMLHTRPTFVFVSADARVDPVLIAPTVDRRLIREGIWTDCLTEDVRFWGPDAAEDVYPDHVTALGELIRPGSRVGIDGLRFDWVSELGESLGVAFTPVSDAVDEIRKIKDEDEIARVRKANELSFDILDTVVPELLSSADSITEIELAAEIEHHARMRGADGFGCPTLVSHGDKMLAPHSPPLDKEIGRDIPTRVVLANTLEGYTADVIRSYVIGGVPQEIQMR